MPAGQGKHSDQLSRSGRRRIAIAAMARGDRAGDQTPCRAAPRDRQPTKIVLRIPDKTAHVSALREFPPQGRTRPPLAQEHGAAERAGLDGAADTTSVAGIADFRLVGRRRVQGDLAHVATDCYRLQKVSSKWISASACLGRRSVPGRVKRMLSAYLLALISGMNASARRSRKRTSCAVRPASMSW
jgi:hypothetical protein